MQFADHGNLGEIKKEDLTFHINPRVLSKLIANIEDKVSPLVLESDDPVKSEIRRLEDGKIFGAECLSMREKVTKYIFY
jgi:hypothetical protein